MRLDTEELRSFITVARAGGLTAAAALLHVSVSALSRRMARMEQQTRLSLFHRRGATLELTAAGRDLAARLTPLLGELAQAVEEARRGEVAPRRLRLLGVAPAMRGLLPRAAAWLLREQPGLEIDLADAAPEELRAAVLSGAAALGIGYGAEARPPLAFEPLLRDPLVFACPLGHRFAGRRSLAWRELEGERLFGLLDGAEQEGIEPLLAQHRLGRLFAGRQRGAAAVLGLLEAGLGVAALPRSAIPPRWRGFATPLLREPALAQQIGIWSRPGAPEDAARARLRSLLRSAAAPEA